MDQAHGWQYTSHRPTTPQVPSTPIMPNYEGNPDGAPYDIASSNFYGIKRPLGFKIPADTNSAYYIAGITSASELRAVQVVAEDIDATGTIVIQYTVNGRDWSDLPTPVSETIAAGVGRQTVMFSLASLPCTLFRLAWQAGSIGAGTIEVYSI